jgi:hypothetical protein
VATLLRIRMPSSDVGASGLLSLEGRWWETSAAFCSRHQPAVERQQAGLNIIFLECMTMLTASVVPLKPLHSLVTSSR